MNDIDAHAHDAFAPPPKKSGVWRTIKRLFMLLVLVAIAAAFYIYVYPAYNEATVAESDAQLKNQIAALTSRVQTLENRVQALSNAPVQQVVGSSEPAAAPVIEVPKPTEPSNAAEVAHLQSDMVSLSAAMTALQAEVKTTGAAASEMRETSQTLIASVVAYIQLRDATGSGRGFATELATLRDASKNDAVLQSAAARLDPYSSGAPTLMQLRDELIEREPAVNVAIAKGSAQNWWERVLAQLHGLITVRSLHGGEGDALAHVEDALKVGNTMAALEAFTNLPADARSNLADWQKQLEVRQDIDEEMAAITAHFTTLSSPAVSVP